MPANDKDIADYYSSFASDLPEDTRKALWELYHKATPEAVRRVLPQCTHPVERRQRYTAVKDYCQVCGRMVPL